MHDGLGERGLVEAGGSGDEAELESGACYGRQLDHPARLERETREALLHDLADPRGAAYLGHRPR